MGGYIGVVGRAECTESVNGRRPLSPRPKAALPTHCRRGRMVYARPPPPLRKSASTQMLGASGRGCDPRGFLTHTAPASGQPRAGA